MGNTVFGGIIISADTDAVIKVFLSEKIGTLPHDAEVA
jgi:hypothetical protein